MTALPCNRLSPCGGFCACFPAPPERSITDADVDAIADRVFVMLGAIFGPPPEPEQPAETGNHWGA